MIRQLAVWCVIVLSVMSTVVAEERRPNILMAISDDQSAPYASAYGCTGVSTPAFDRLAKEGVLFTNAFAASPGCSPSRAALLTGRHPWQLEHAGTHGSWFPTKYQTYPELLEEQGYFVGYTGKGWGPGRHFGREHNPAGPEFAERTNDPPYSGMKKNDYAANFGDFLDAKPDDQPFCFWFGTSEPHRIFEQDSWKKAGKRLEDAVVPAYLPDTPEIRGDILDYCVEIEWFDLHLQRIITQLEEAGELDNTLIIATSDNGMSFPRAKANCYEDGIHVPLAIRWGDHVPGGRTVDDLVGFVDLSATILEAAGVEHPSEEFPPVGRSLSNILMSDASGIIDPSRSAVFAARERHSSSRYQNLAYPQRAMRTADSLYIRNFRPERWPAGAPQKFDKPPRSDQEGFLGDLQGGYHDIDACPTLTFFIENQAQSEITEALHLAVDHRPSVEIFAIKDDPSCLQNLAGQPSFRTVEQHLTQQFQHVLRATGDPRLLNGGDIFETYRRYSKLRSFPTPADVTEREQSLREQGWQRLFNGRDLTGWTASDADGSFEVINGMIKAEATSGSAHLFYTGDVHKADFSDFELSVECLTYPHANGGILFHSSFENEGVSSVGYEVEINNTHQNGIRTGSVVGVAEHHHSQVSDEAIFYLRITVRGEQVTVDVHGRETIKGSKLEPGHGTFALQAHDPDSVVFYRNIWVKPLD